jgi:hypothetical protein
VTSTNFGSPKEFSTIMGAFDETETIVR